MSSSHPQAIQTRPTLSKSNNMPLKVIVVGAGVAGLSAAIALRQAGHTVTVLEKSRFATEVGAAILLAPNGTRVLSKLGFDFDLAHGYPVTTWDTLDGLSLEKISGLNLESAETRYGAPVITVHRVDLHNELMRLATLDDSDGCPKVEILLGSNIVGGSAEQGILQLADGSMKQADLIVAADGMHSVLKRVVLGNAAPKASPAGLSTFRFLIPTKDIVDDPQLPPVFSRAGKGLTILADPCESIRERHIVWYDCHGGEIRNFAATHPTQSNDGEGKDCKKLMEQEFAHFHPGFSRITQKAANVSLWPFYAHDPLPKWSHGKMLLIGDAAHPMLSFGGQGSNQAIEDAGALLELFKSASSESLPERFHLFENVRRLRASRIQVLSKVRVGKEAAVKEELSRYTEPPGSAVPTTFAERIEHDYSYDVFEHCTRVLEKGMLGKEAPLSGSYVDKKRH